MIDIDDDDDNVQDFECLLDEEEKEEEKENEKENVEIMQINEKINETQKNGVEESWNLYLEKLLDDISENSV